MIEILPESRGNILGFRATGTLSDRDYKEIVIPKLESLFAAHGKLNVLFFMDEDFEGWDMKGAWDDASYGMKHRADFEKLALVGGPEWVHWCFKLAGFLMKGEIRIFPVDELEKAWAWIED